MNRNKTHNTKHKGGDQKSDSEQRKVGRHFSEVNKWAKNEFIKFK